MPATQRAPIDYVAGERIGCSAAVFGDFGFVGACDAAHGGRQAAGMVHVLRLASGTTFGRVTPPRAMAMAQFGTSIAVGASAQDAWAEYRQRRAMQLRTKQRDWGDGGM